MPETYLTPLRIHRVNTRRRSLRALQCPLEPELLVAEFAGELPPDVAHAVREHIAVCSTCGERSRALRQPYELLSSLGHEPVSHVPDLRDVVHHRVYSHRFYNGMLRMAGKVGRGGALAIVSIVGLVALVAFIAANVLFSASAWNVSRSSNTLAHVPPAAASGMLFAETDKLVTIQDGSGRSWQVAEVIAVSQRTGAVIHSLPASSNRLQTASASQLPVAIAVSPGGSTVYEVTAPDSSRKQALVAVDVATGEIRFAEPLTYPDGRALAAGIEADALAVAPNGSALYVGLSFIHWGTESPRVLVLNSQTGKVATDFGSGIGATIPMPPPPGSLPASAFPNLVPKLSYYADNYTVSVAAHGALAVSSDGQWLFDVLMLSDAHGPQYAVVQRFDTLTGLIQQELAIPGDFSLAEFIASPAQAPQATQSTSSTSQGLLAATQQLYLVKGSPDAAVYVVDPSDTGPTLSGMVALGGPASRPNDVFSGSLSVSPSADGTQLYVTQNVTTQDGLINGHDLWLVDTQGMSILAHRLDSGAADAVRAGTGANSPAYILRGGQVLLLAPDLSGTPTNWLDLNGGHVIRFLASGA